MLFHSVHSIPFFFTGIFSFFSGHFIVSVGSISRVCSADGFFPSWLFIVIMVYIKPIKYLMEVNARDVSLSVSLPCWFDVSLAHLLSLCLISFHASWILCTLVTRRFLVVVVDAPWAFYSHFFHFIITYHGFALCMIIFHLICLFASNKWISSWCFLFKNLRPRIMFSFRWFIKVRYYKGLSTWNNHKPRITLHEMPLLQQNRLTERSNFVNSSMRISAQGGCPQRKITDFCHLTANS